VEGDITTEFIWRKERQPLTHRLSAYFKKKVQDFLGGESRPPKDPYQ
jgi:hypothetical protein